jgi:hypothetical protein
VSKAKLSKFQQQLGPLVEPILTGHLLSIDPSSGSRDSQPGYAVFKAGELQDSGHIAVNPAWEPARRLRYLGQALQSEFACPDVLVCENIGLIHVGGGFMNKSVISLQRSIGVVMGSFDAPIVEIAPITWRKNIPANYKKTDEADAIMLALTAIWGAMALRSIPVPPLSERLLAKLSTGEWTTPSGAEEVTLG